MGKSLPKASQQGLTAANLTGDFSRGTSLLSTHVVAIVFTSKCHRLPAASSPEQDCIFSINNSGSHDYQLGY